MSAAIQTQYIGSYAVGAAARENDLLSLSGESSFPCFLGLPSLSMHSSARAVGSHTRAPIAQGPMTSGEEVDMASMDDLWTARRFAMWKYGTREPTRGQVQTVMKMCQDGKLPAAKVGREWRIDVSKILEVFA